MTYVFDKLLKLIMSVGRHVISMILLDYIAPLMSLGVRPHRCIPGGIHYSLGHEFRYMNIGPEILFLSRNGKNHILLSDKNDINFSIILT